MKRNRILTLALAPVLLSAAPLFSVSAEEEAPRWFEVEVILFTRNVPVASVNEHWPVQQQVLNTQQAPDLLSPLLFPAPADALAADCTPQGIDHRLTDAPAEPLVDAEQQALTAPTDTHTTVTPNCAPAPLLQAKADVPKIVAADALPVYDAAPYLLDAASLQLVDQRKIIERRPEFSLMLHTGWRQAMAPRRQSQQWHLFAGKDFSEQFLADGTVRQKAAEPLTPCAAGSVTIDGECIAADTTTDQTAPSAGPLTTEQVQANITQMLADQELATALAAQPQPAVTADTPPAPLWQLDGLFRVYLEHYLYIDADFNYHVVGERELPFSTAEIEAQPSLTDGAVALPGPNLTGDDQGAEILPLTGADDPESGGTLVAEKTTEAFLYHYRLSQSRRLRSGELHYFDHPLMGILVQIRTHDYRQPPAAPVTPVSSESVEGVLATPAPTATKTADTPPAAG